MASNVNDSQHLAHRWARAETSVFCVREWRSSAAIEPRCTRLLDQPVVIDSPAAGRAKAGSSPRRGAPNPESHLHSSVTNWHWDGNQQRGIQSTTQDRSITLRSWASTLLM